MEFLRALPVLPVHDLDAEIAFYEALMFHVQHREDDFAALQRDAVLFGLRSAEVAVPPPGLSWQLEVDDVTAVLALALEAGLGVAEEPQRRGGEWTIRLQTPAGYELVLEGPAGSLLEPDVRALALALPEVVELVDSAGRAEFRRAGGAWLVRVSAGVAEVHVQGVTRVELATASADHVEELLRSAWEENSPPPAEVGPLRTE
ncbi:VOC family protein [Kineococcus sp. GCM10028916]|uniref:VOC family protein n=1 Tax=Kineococcus sp. GCM10028916 TaxID=3273394 RepID=UPI003645CEC8